jgi:hypothetical protein
MRYDLSGQWQPFQENEPEQEPREASDLEPEIDDSGETDSRADSSKRDSRFRRRID